MAGVLSLPVWALEVAWESSALPGCSLQMQDQDTTDLLVVGPSIWFLPIFSPLVYFHQRWGLMSFGVDRTRDMTCLWGGTMCPAQHLHHWCQAVFTWDRLDLWFTRLWCTPGATGSGYVTPGWNNQTNLESGKFRKKIVLDSSESWYHEKKTNQDKTRGLF